MIDIDVKEVKQYESDLKTFARKAFPYATRSAINGMAFAAQKRGRENLRSDMTLRNRYSEQSVRVEQARSLTVSRQEAIAGSIVEYLEAQEFGGTTDRRGAHKTVIPTGYAAGQEGARPRTRLPRKVNKLTNVKLRQRVRKGEFASRRQEAFLRALLAAQEGDKFVYIPAGGDASSGIYRVWGTRKRKGRYRGVKLKMVYSFRRAPSRIPRNAWLRPATADAVRERDVLYAKALVFQLHRLGVLGYR